MYRDNHCSIMPVLSKEYILTHKMERERKHVLLPHMQMCVFSPTHAPRAAPYRKHLTKRFFKEYTQEKEEEGVHNRNTRSSHLMNVFP